jgi:amino acid transporter
MQPSSKPRIRPLSLFVLAMMNTAVVVGLEGLPEVGSFGLPLILYYAVFTIIFFIPVGLVAAELGVGWPHDGGIYRWIREALGERWAFVGVWCQWVQIIVWYPTVLAVCSVSVAYMIDPALRDNAWFIMLLSLGTFWFATVFNFKGVHFSGWLTTTFLYVGTLFPVLLAIGLAIWWIGSGHESAIPLSFGAIIPDINSIGEIVGILAIFSFLSGLEVNAVHFRHVDNPQRSIPRSLLISGILVLGMSVLGALSVAVLVPVHDIDLASGTLQVFSRVLEPMGVGWLVPVLALLAFAGMVGHIMVWVIGPTESIRVAADDGLVPPFFQKTTSSGAPLNVMLVQAVVVSLMCVTMLFVDLNHVFYTLTIASAQIYLVMYVLMFISVIVLRYTKPDVERSFLIPGGRLGLWVVAGGGGLTAITGIIIMFWPPTTDDMSMSGGLFTGILLTAFIVLVGLPIVLFQFRNPNWGRDAKMPGADDTTSAWKRAD